MNEPSAEVVKECERIVTYWVNHARVGSRKDELHNVLLLKLLKLHERSVGRIDIKDFSRWSSRAMKDAVHDFKRGVARESKKSKLFVPVQFPERYAGPDQTELKRNVHEALECLPADQREVVEAVHLHNKSVREVADERGVGPATVKGLLDAGLARLKEVLS